MYKFWRPLFRRTKNWLDFIYSKDVKIMHNSHIQDKKLMKKNYKGDYFLDNF